MKQRMIIKDFPRIVFRILIIIMINILPWLSDIISKHPKTSKEIFFFIPADRAGFRPYEAPGLIEITYIRSQ